MNSMQGLKSPLIAEQSGAEKELKLRFDVSQYSPEEIMVEFLSQYPFLPLFATLLFSSAEIPCLD